MVGILIIKWAAKQAIEHRNVSAHSTRQPITEHYLFLCTHACFAAHRIAKISPTDSLSIAQVCLLLQAVLPQPVLDLPAVLALIAYQQRHNYAAYCSHRKRLLAQLQGLR
jgi:hypothetical protein